MMGQSMLTNTWVIIVFLSIERSLLTDSGIYYGHMLTNARIHNGHLLSHAHIHTVHMLAVKRTSGIVVINGSIAHRLMIRK